MGGCCGSGAKMIVKYENRQEKFDHIADIEILKLQITERLSLPFFDLLIDGKPILRNEDLRVHLHSRALVEILVLKKEPIIERPAVKETCVEVKPTVRVPPSFESFLYKIVDWNNNEVASTLMLAGGHFLINKNSLSTSKHFYIDSLKNKKKLEFVNEYEGFKLLKTEKEQHPFVLLENTTGLRSKAVILTNDSRIELVQNPENEFLYKTSSKLNDDYLGFPVFYKNSLIGFVGSVFTNSVNVTSAKTLLIDVLLPVKKVKQSPVREKQVIIPISSIKFANSIPDPPKEVELTKDKKTVEQQDLSENESFEIVLDLSTGLNAPDSFAYVFNKPENLFAYSVNSFSRIIRKIHLDIEDGGSLTTTALGLLVVSEQNV